MTFCSEFYAILCLMVLLKKMISNINLRLQSRFFKRLSVFWLKDKRGKEKKTLGILCKKNLFKRFYVFFLWFWPETWKLYAFLYFMPSDHSNLLLFITDTGVTCSYTSILMFDAYCATYWEPSRTSKIRFLTKTARGFQSLTIFTKSSILDVLQDTEHSSEL